jgi:hypothetical protein
VARELLKSFSRKELPMSLKAIVASLILGTSSIALAAPNAPAFAPAVVRDHRMPPRYQAWSYLASGQLVRGRDTIKINSLAKLDQLKLDLVGAGSMYVDKLVVTFGNGRSQTITLNKSLTQRSSSITVDLKGNDRKVTAITVLGRGTSSGFRAGASFKISAR